VTTRAVELNDDDDNNNELIIIITNIKLSTSCESNYQKIRIICPVYGYMKELCGSL